MTNSWIRKSLCAIALSFITIQAQAGGPVWTFEPNTATTITLPSTGSAIVEYTVTNQSQKPHTLRMNPIQGISSSGCSETLNANQSCILRLTIDAASLNQSVYGGPVLCQLGNSNLCYQPSISNQLNITVINQALQPTSQYTNIYAQTQNLHFVYSFNNGSFWNRIINSQNATYWNYYWGIWDIIPAASVAIDAQGDLYQAIQGYYEGSSGTLISSSDGIIWNIFNVGFPAGGDSPTVSLIDGTTLYVGTVNGYVVSTSLPITNSSTWNMLNSGNALNGSSIQTFVADSTGTIYAGTLNGFVFYSSDQGNTWSQTSSQPSSGNQVISLAITTSNGQSTLYALTSDGNIQSTLDQGQTWTVMTVNGLASGDTVTVLAALNNLVYVGSNLSYVYTLTPSGSALNVTQQSASIDGSNVTVLTVAQGPLSSSFVEGVLAPNGIGLPVNGSTNLTVTNYSHYIAKNVQAQGLPAGVVQTPHANCASIVPNGTCTITLTTTMPFAPANVAIIATNLSGPIEQVAFISSINGYNVYNVNPDTRIAYVVDNADAPGSPTIWSPTDAFLNLRETSFTPAAPCNAPTDGYCDTQVILAQNYSGSYAAGLCAAKNGSSSLPASFTPGLWYLPSLCELGYGLYGVSTSEGFLPCQGVPTGILTLRELGFITDFTSIEHWASTQSAQNLGTSNDSSWVGKGFATQGVLNFFDWVGTSYGVRCAQGIAY
jgi:hypothetical protein